MKKQWYLSWIVAVLIGGCAGTTSEDYQAAVDAGWFHYQQGAYTDASGEFILALQADPTGWEAWSGLGWSRLRRDSLDGAFAAFSSGSELTGATADLFAGWAFVLNAQKAYATSTTQASQALNLDAAWAFTHENGLDAVDLKILRAENYFALGQFTQSLAAVQEVNALFSANVATSDGQASLAGEIERLKSVH